MLLKVDLLRLRSPELCNGQIIQQELLQADYPIPHSLFDDLQRNRLNCCCKTELSFERLFPDAGDVENRAEDRSTGLGKLFDRRAGLIKIEQVSPTNLLALTENGCLSTFEADAYLLSYGIMRFYRSKQDEVVSALENPVIRRQNPHNVRSSGKVIAMLNVPEKIDATALARFIGKEALLKISHARILHANYERSKVVLLKFRRANEALNFIDQKIETAAESWDGRISLLQIDSMSIDLTNSCEIDQRSSPLIEEAAHTRFRTEPIELVAAGQTLFHELPTCTACMERMDDSVTGLVPTNAAISQEGDQLYILNESQCYVCKVVAASTDTNTRSKISCSQCDININIWICLICGNLGCGRYDYAHAMAHFEVSGHPFSMSLDSMRVWDYVRDEYVHRLIQNDSSQSLLLGTIKEEEFSEKGVGSEMDFGAKSQQDSDRKNWEQENNKLRNECRLLKVEKEMLKGTLTEHKNLLSEEKSERASLKQKIHSLEQIIESLKKKTEILVRNHAEAEKQCKDEKAINESLLSNIAEQKKISSSLQEQLNAKDLDIRELNEQLRDLMINLSIRDQITNEADASELHGGTVLLPQHQKEKKKGGTGKKKR